MSQTPSIGRIVHYKLNAGDAEAINRRRKDYNAARAASYVPGVEKLGTGEQVHVGNGASAGDVYPAMIVRTWGSTPESSVQLQVFLDGNDTYWATSVNEGDGERAWSWPPRV